MRIDFTSIFVDDQDRALAFYTDVLGFVKREDIPVGEYRWLTVVSPESPDGVQLLLEPNAHAAARAYQRALREDGIPVNSFGVSDLDAEHERLRGLGVEFVGEIDRAEWGASATLDDTCGNLVRLHQIAG